MLKLVLLLITPLFLFSQGKKVLITGGAGFIGSHLCERLINNGHTVYCLDNLHTGNLKNLKEVVDHQNFHFIKQDVVQEITIDHLDEIYHLACPASPRHYQEDPIKTLKTCFIGALNMLELAKKTNAKIFFSSTSEIYGDPAIHPQVESYWGNSNPIGIRACYDEGKRCAETLFFDFHRTYNIDIRVGRIFNTYGPRMNPKDGRVIPNFINQALQDIPITIYGTGKQTRSYCYVSDLVDAILLFMESSYPGPVNLGNPEEYTVLETASIIKQLIDSDSAFIYKELPFDDPQRRCPDISLARKELGYEPKVCFREGLKKTIAYFSEEN